MKSMAYDLLLKNGYLVDPRNSKEGYYDVAISAGKVEAIEKDMSASNAMQVIDVSEKIVAPGLIDTHVHVTGRSRQYGYRMMARSGVTTALDCAGPTEEVVEALATWGAGLNIAVLDGVVPGETVSGVNPCSDELEKFIDKSLEKGAFGVKIMGGHYPLTPEATREIISLTNERLAYVAFHAGTTNKGSNIEGMQEALQIAEGLKVQLCHVNAYCRGLTLGDSVEETQQALSWLSEIRNRGIVSESHVGPFNGTSGKCQEGIPLSQVTCTCLKTGGYTATDEGLAEAIKKGYALVNKTEGDEIGYASPDDGYQCWLENRTDVTVSFPVNKRDTAFLCATKKDEKGNFIVDALSTDGGGIPRNYLVSKGLLLVKFNALTLNEWVWKVSTIPAMMMGLRQKGNLAPGADADITVVDLEQEKTSLSIVAGRIVMQEGVVHGQKGTIITTARGRSHLSGLGIQHEVVRLEDALMYKRARGDK